MVRISTFESGRSTPGQRAAGSRRRRPAPGIRMSMRTTSGRSRRGQRRRLPAVGRLADDLDVGLGAPGSAGSRSGRAAGRRRSAPGSSRIGRSTSRPTARAAARSPDGSRLPGRAVLGPAGAGRRGARPARASRPGRGRRPGRGSRPRTSPSSMTSSSSVAARRSGREPCARAVPACLSTLVSASWTIR